MTNQELRDLVKKSLLLSDETRETILSQLETLDEDQKNDLESLLLDAQEKQNELLVETLQANPELLTQIKKRLRDASFARIKEQENSTKKEEEQTLSDLEDELNNLFE